VVCNIAFRELSGCEKADYILTAAFIIDGAKNEKEDSYNWRGRLFGLTSL